MPARDVLAFAKQEDAIPYDVPDVKGYLDGKLYLEHTLPEPVSGKVGLWSKADSYMHFDDYKVLSATQ